MDESATELVLSLSESMDIELAMDILSGRSGAIQKAMRGKADSRMRVGDHGVECGIEIDDAEIVDAGLLVHLRRLGFQSGGRVVVLLGKSQVKRLLQILAERMCDDGE